MSNNTNTIAPTTATEIRESIANNPNPVAGAFDADIKPGTRVIIRKAQGNKHLIGTEGIVVAARRVTIDPAAAATIRKMGREPLAEHYLVTPIGKATMIAITCPLDGLEAVGA